MPLIYSSLYFLADSAKEEPEHLGRLGSSSIVRVRRRNLYGISLGVETSDLRNRPTSSASVAVSPGSRIGQPAVSDGCSATSEGRAWNLTRNDLTDPRLCCACAGRLALICRPKCIQSELYSNFNNIRVRSFILNGAPFATTPRTFPFAVLLPMIRTALDRVDDEWMQPCRAMVLPLSSLSIISRAKASIFSEHPIPH